MPRDQPFALVGGLAVSARCEPRFTADLDFVVDVSDDLAAERVVFACQQRGYLLEATLEQRGTGRMATARLRRDDTAPYVDLLFAACGIEREVAAAAQPLVVRGERVPVATTGHLIAMKLVSRDDKRRPRDRQDLVELARVATATEWRRAETAVELVTERGFARRRDLRSALVKLRASISKA